jgi:putative ABC transport system permease protein
MGDLRYAVRSFRRTPAFTAIVLLTLSLGIGANTAIFSVVRAVLLSPLPYPAASELHRVRGGTSRPDMTDWIAHTRSFAAIGGYRPQSFDHVGTADAERLDGALVTGGLLEMLGARPALGRLFTDADALPGADRIAIVTAAFWRTRLGSDPTAVGRIVHFNAAAYRVAGVLEPGFELPGTGATVFAPLDQGSREARARGAHTLRAVVRLRTGVTAAHAQQEMDALAARLETAYPQTNRDVRFVLVPLKESLTSAARTPLMILFGTVLLVLLVACVNVANLLIGHGAGRRPELMVRTALGATRLRLARQLTIESLLLSVTGGALGLIVAWWIIKAVIGLAPAGVPRVEHIGLDAQTLAYTALVCIGTGLLFGTLPAWAALRGRLMSSGGRTTPATGWLRSSLMIAEVAVALVLVSSAGLLMRSFTRLVNQPMGFDTSRLVTANITLTAQRYLDVAARTRLYDAFEEAVQGLPGVRGVALTTDLPIAGSPIFHNLAFEGRPVPAGSEPEVYYRGINAGYFDALGIPLRAGRRFERTDRAGAPPVAIVNEAFVREYYPAEDPIGRRIRWASGNGEWITIVGVAADVRGLSLDRHEVPAVHIPFAQERMPWRTFMDVAVRTDADVAHTTLRLHQILRAIDPAVPLTGASTMEGVLATSVADRRFSLYLLASFAVVTLLLAAAGTYGVMAHAVAQRTRELGVRLALGAKPVDLFTLVVGRGMAVAAAGVIVGLAGAMPTSRVLEGMLFEIAPNDPRTLGISAIVLLTASLLAAWIPARRAAAVDPLIVLRSE